MQLSEYQSGFDPDFTAGALLAKPGIATGPVKSSFGYHVILIRPFVEVATDISALLEANAGELLLTDTLRRQKSRSILPTVAGTQPVVPLSQTKLTGA